jgi:hypothetical protein
MPDVMLSLRPARSDKEQRCGVCGADFVPAEDSGSRVLSLKPGGQDAVSGLMCGGCHSKWAHGSTVTLKTEPLPARAGS